MLSRSVLGFDQRIKNGGDQHMNRLRRAVIVVSMIAATTFSFTSAVHGAEPELKLEGGGCYYPEETLRLAFYVTPGNSDNVGDLYVVLKTPDGDFYSYKRWDEPNVLTPFIPNWKAANLRAVSVRVPLSTLPTSTVGRYTFLVGMMKPGTRTLTSNIARMSFYIKKLLEVPVACQCAGNKWSLHTDTFYLYVSPVMRVEIYMDGTVPLTLAGSDVAGTVSGVGPLSYQNINTVADCVTDVAGEWAAQADGTYGSNAFSLELTTVPDVVTGTITCPDGTVPFPPYTPNPPPDGAAKSLTLPMSPGYTMCSPIKLPGWTGDTCLVLTCP
jgi:hypothetical protein